ncbi:MAG TPA: hypothetical protein VJJ76_00265 [archaeon]|nr:hypothetical protein [archaeon]
MHVTMTIAAALVAILVVGALAVWYFYKPALPGGPAQQPVTGAASEADALGALQNELDSATSQIDTTAIENSLLQQK